MKFRLTVTVDIEDPVIWVLDDEGWPTQRDMGRLSKDDVADYIADAVHSWGGQFAPGDVFFPRNIRSVTVRGGESIVQSVGGSHGNS